GTAASMPATAASSVMSAATNVNRGPRSGAGARSAPTTVPPSASRRVAVARPMPDAAPVTTNVRELARSGLAMDEFLSVAPAQVPGRGSLSLRPPNGVGSAALRSPTADRAVLHGNVRAIRIWLRRLRCRHRAGLTARDGAPVGAVFDRRLRRSL